MYQAEKICSEQFGIPEKFDYRAVLALVNSDVFKLWGKGSCSLIEWCVADIAEAVRTRNKDEVQRHACWLSIMAGYFGAKPIERLAHEIERKLETLDVDLLDRRSEQLEAEARHFLPLLRERLQAA